MSNQERHRGFVSSPELDEIIERHKLRLDDQRSEGAELTSISTTIRNLILEGDRAITAREAKAKR